MNLLQKLRHTLQKPFPEDERRDYYRNSVALGVFVALFLYVFEPFGISTLESNQFFICLGFGSMTFLAAMVYELVVYQLLSLKGKRENWTYGKWIFHNMMIMLLISLANFLFARFLLFGFIDWNLFPTMIYSTFMIGILPIAMLGAYSLFRHEKRYEALALEINHQPKPIFSKKGGAKNIALFGIPSDSIRYVEALQNYVKIGYLNPSGDFKIQTERLTLKEVLAKAEGSAIVKSHRSFLVNKEAIVSVKGNAQGLSLTLSDCELAVPVSRTFVPFFKGD